MTLVPMFLNPVAARGADRGNSDFTLQVQLSSPPDEVWEAVQQTAQDQIVHGTYSYEKERTLYGAYVAESSKVLPKLSPNDKVIYKIADNVLAPKNFKESGDIGTITVRYVVHDIDAATASLQIDAVFVDARHQTHPSMGVVESSEYAAIRDRIQAIKLEKQAVDVRASTGESSSRDPANASGKPSELPTGSLRSAPPAASVSDATSPADLQQELERLRRDVVRRVVAPGAQVKAAPFHGATNLTTLPAAAEVLVLIVTPHWYGVETEDGHRGWVHQKQLEPIP
jgi:hypothetical protein